MMMVVDGRGWRSDDALWRHGVGEVGVKNHRKSDDVINGQPQTRLDLEMNNMNLHYP